MAISTTIHGRTPASGGDHGRPPVLSAHGIRKDYGPTCALRDAQLDVGAGEVHALLGENGAGKSTLLKILVGVLRPDRGELLLDGRPLALPTVAEAIRRGIVPVHQRLSVLPHLTIAENLFAFELAAGAGCRRSRIPDARERAVVALRSVGLDLSPATPVASLSLAQRQLVEIARSVVRDVRVLLLDEPTTSLSGTEVERLFTAVRWLREQGRSVLFISHRLDEVSEICDRVTVLRDGVTVLDGVPLAATSRDRLIGAMVGKQVEEIARKASTTSQEIVLRARGLAVPGVLEPVDLTLRKGEIVGVVGLIGSGALSLGAALAGAERAVGEVEVAGSPVRVGNRVAALGAGVAYIPGDRDTDGIFPTMSVLENASPSVLGASTRRGFLRPRLERSLIEPWLRRLAVKPANPDAPVRALSGGNQQKVAVVRSLATPGARVLVALEPTRGVDVGARRDIHAALIEAAASGMAVVLGSSDLDEVLELGHRLLVMRRGSVVAELPEGASAERVLALLTGAAA